MNANAALPGNQCEPGTVFRRLSGNLWVNTGIAMFLFGVLLLALGSVIKTKAVAPDAAAPPPGCEAGVIAASADGGIVTLDNGWCSPLTLQVPPDVAKTASRAAISSPAWVTTDQNGTLTSFEAAVPGKAGPAGTCDAITRSAYAAGEKAAAGTIGLSLLDCPRRLTVPDDLAAIAGGLAAGDHVSIGTDGNGKLYLLRTITCLISWPQAAGAVALAFTASWVLLLIVTSGHPWVFIIGIDQRLSNSQTQAYLWFIVLVSVYLAAFALRLYHTSFFGGIGAPVDLLALAGISAGSFAGARASNWVQTSRSDGGAQKPPGSLTGSRWERLQDLFKNDAGQYDLGDFQMIALTVAAVAIYIVISVDALTSLSFTRHVDLPQVDETLIGGTAISQGAYLLKKFASPLGN
jgi:hypothetical protein